MHFKRGHKNAKQKKKSPMCFKMELLIFNVLFSFNFRMYKSEPGPYSFFQTTQRS